MNAKDESGVFGQYLIDVTVSSCNRKTNNEDVNKADNDGDTPLHLASLIGG